MDSQCVQRGLLIAAWALAGCGGVAEERVASIEAQLNELKREQQAQAAAAREAQTKLDTAVQSLAQSQESQKKLEEIIEVMQRELNDSVARSPAGRTAAAAASSAATPASVSVSAEQSSGAPSAAPSSPAAATGASPSLQPDSGNAAALIDAVLLGEAAGRNVSFAPADGGGGTYQVRRGWLIEQLRLAASSKGLPKLVPDKKTGGLAVRGVKPKSLAEQLGLKNNDVILAAGGSATTTTAALADALKATHGSVALKVKRKGAEVVLTYAVVDS